LVAAGRGVLLAPEILSHHRSKGVSFHVLDGAKEKLEILLIRKKCSEPATVDSFVKILKESVRQNQKQMERTPAPITEDHAVLPDGYFGTNRHQFADGW
jgi:hypothetical protein